MAGLLEQTVREWSSSEFEWGSRDCGLSVLEYVCRAVNMRPATLPYHTDERTAGELLQSSGGLERYAASLVESLGLQETLLPARGDVGVLNLPVAGLTCAVCLGERWMMRGESGVTLLATPQERIVRAWRIP